MNCNHQFIRVGESNDQTKVVCPFCGQVRLVGDDGTVVILNEHGKITKKTTDTDSD